MRRASLLAFLVCLALAGCGGGGSGTATTRTTAAPPTTSARAAPPRLPGHGGVVTVRAIDGDTGKPLPGAAISVHGAVRRSRVAFVLRPRRLATVHLWAPGYEPRAVPVPFGRQHSAVLRLYRRD